MFSTNLGMILEIFAATIFAWTVWYIVTVYIRRKKMPPGPFPFPFVGNIPQLMMSDPVNVFSELAEKYGDILTIDLPFGPAVLISNATIAREAKLRNLNGIAGKSPKTSYPFNVILGADLLTADYSTAFIFRKRVFKSAMHVFGAGIQQASSRAGHAVDTAINEIEMKQGQPFSPKKLLESSILVQLWEWLTSKKVALDDPIIKDLSEFGEIVAKQALHAILYQVLPFLSYLPTQFNRDIKRAQQVRSEIFPPEFKAHLDTYTPSVVRDLTDNFISSYEKEIAKETTKDFGSIDDISGLMLDVIFAGSDTTSTSLTWFLLYMVLHPSVQDKIHQELDSVVGKDRPPCWEDSKHMPYLQATLCEVLRISGVVPSSGANATRDINIAGYHIPKGTLILLNIKHFHQNNRDWPEPKQFKPERFLDPIGKFLGWTKLHGFMPFSVGRRECAGQSLAKIMMFTFASILLYRYKFELPEGAEMPTVEVTVCTTLICPQEFQIVAKNR